MIVPLLYIWGDDELLAERLVARFAAKLGQELGSPLERWDLRADPTSASADVAQLYERLATPAMFGGGTLAVVANPGALVKRNDTRDRIVETIALMAPGHALAVVEAARSPRRWRHDRRRWPRGSLTKPAIAGSRSPSGPRASSLTGSGRA